MRSAGGCPPHGGSGAGERGAGAHGVVPRVGACRRPRPRCVEWLTHWGDGGGGGAPQRAKANGAAGRGPPPAACAPTGGEEAKPCAFCRRQPLAGPVHLPTTQWTSRRAGEAGGREDGAIASLGGQASLPHTRLTPPPLHPPHPPATPLQAAAPSVDVALEDQERINRFSRLNTRAHELEAQLAALKVCGWGVWVGGGGDGCGGAGRAEERPPARPPLRDHLPPCATVNTSQRPRTWKRLRAR